MTLWKSKIGVVSATKSDLEESERFPFFVRLRLRPLSLVFICRGNPRRSGILLFPDCPRFCRLMKTRNRRYPRSSGMDGDKSGKSGAFLFSRRVPDFCDGRRSFPINENSKFVLRGRRRWISLVTNPPKLLGSSLPITNKDGVSRKHEW